MVGALGDTPVESVTQVLYCVGMERMHVDLDKPWLTVADICEYMDVSTFVVTSVLRSGELRAVKFGREWRVSKADFEDWINEQRAVGDHPTAVGQSPSRAGFPDT
jgi:excisionase family DNA binding protein